ncbi:hypothetical protein D3C76_1388010 [compost metagenome]
MPRSVPACGSVRHMEPAQVPAYMFGRYWFFSSSLACASRAKQAPEVRAEYRVKLLLAA